MMLTPTFRLEPGDGTGCSIADGHARNRHGICGSFGCGNKLSENAAKYVHGRVCRSCEHQLEKVLVETVEGIVG